MFAARKVVRCNQFGHRNTPCAFQYPKLVFFYAENEKTIKNYMRKALGDYRTFFETFMSFAGKLASGGRADSTRGTSAT